MEEIYDPSTERDVARRTSRAALKMWIGVLLALVSAMFGIGALILIWFGFFPGLVAILLCLPIGFFSVRLIRGGRPPTTA